MINSFAMHTTLLGDRGKRDHYDRYNAGDVPYIIQPGGSLWGTDWQGETKVVSQFDNTQRVAYGTPTCMAAPPPTSGTPSASATQRRTEKL